MGQDYAQAAIDAEDDQSSGDQPFTDVETGIEPSAAVTDTRSEHRNAVQPESEPRTEAQYENNGMSEAPHGRRSVIRPWMIGVIAVMLAIPVLYIGLGGDRADHPAAGADKKSQQALPDKVRRQLDDLQQMKSEIARMRERQLEEQLAIEQAEILKRERDLALQRLREEEEKRLREQQAAKEAARRQREAAAVAAAAEKARKAAEAAVKEADRLSKQRRSEEERLRTERLKLEEQRRQAELEEQRLEEQRRRTELEQKKLEEQRLAEQKLVEERAREEVEAKKRLEATPPGSTEEAAQSASKKETNFVTDPCSSPSARFLSTCR